MVMATGSPSGSVTPPTETFVNRWFVAESTAGFAAALLQSGGEFPGRFAMVVVVVGACVVLVVVLVLDVVEVLGVVVVVVEVDVVELVDVELLVVMVVDVDVEVEMVELVVVLVATVVVVELVVVVVVVVEVLSVEVLVVEGLVVEVVVVELVVGPPKPIRVSWYEPVPVEFTSMKYVAVVGRVNDPLLGGIRTVSGGPNAPADVTLEPSG